MGLPAPPPTEPGWAVALTLLRPQMSQWMGNAATEGVLFRAVKDAMHHVRATWKPQSLEVWITSVNGASTNTLTVPFGHWFRTQPMILIIADDGTKLEACVLSPRLGHVTASDIDGSMGAAPVSIELYEPGKVFGLKVAGVSYTTDFLDFNEREQSLKYLDFLLYEVVE